MQTTQTQNRDIARPGLAAGPVQHNKFVSPARIAEVAIEAGTYVTKGTNATSQCKAPTTANEVTLSGLGFAVFKNRGTNDSGAEYEIGADVEIMREGECWVTSAEQMAVDDKVYVIHVATNRGLVRNDADTANAALLTGAKVVQVASATLCKIRFEDVANY